MTPDATIPESQHMPRIIIRLSTMKCDVPRAIIVPWHLEFPDPDTEIHRGVVKLLILCL